MSVPAVKICGLKDAQTVAHAVSCGAALIGFVFFEKSPRNITIDQAVTAMVPARGKSQTVALTVNASQRLLDDIVCTLDPDFLQFHGQETAEDLAYARTEFDTGIIKAVGVRDNADLQAALDFKDVADILLLDAKPPKDAARPGGHGTAFDWSLLSDWPTDVPYMLAGGLTLENVGDAVRKTGASRLDLSSGVESAPGVKDPKMISAFMDAVHQIHGEGVTA